MNSLWRTIAVAAAVAALCTSGFGQIGEQPVVLHIEVENLLQYLGDVSDISRFATNPNITTITAAPNSYAPASGIGDIVAVNGRPAKGTYFGRGTYIPLRPAAQRGQAVADVTRNGPIQEYIEILQSDGTPIGTLMAIGQTLGSPPPGSPAGLTMANNAIVGGTGAFLGARGQSGIGAVVKAPRAASMTEDPANRRVNGGGTIRVVVRLIPMSRPEVDISPTGPAVYHTADFSPVTATSPARAGEILTIAARNLGPTRPELLPPGTRPFKADPIEVVNSPIEVTVNGKEAEVINGIGWPGTYDLYRVDFRVPAGLPPGQASLKLTAAWIPGPEVKIAVQ